MSATAAAPRWARHLPWIDGYSGLIAGSLVLLVHAPLARLHQLPTTTVLVIGLVNALYGLFALNLARGRPRSRTLLTVLIVANLGWTAVCGGLLAWYAGVASPWAIAHLLGEGLYVAVLGLLERHHRRVILAPR